MNIEFIEGKLHRVKIVPDSDPTSPRDWDNLGTMVCWHRNYNLGDEQPSQSPEDFRMDLACELDDTLEARLERKSDWWEDRYPAGSYGSERWKEWSREMEMDLKETVQAVLDKHIVELPLYLYDHSGITMNTSGFSCRWDSGQVGFIYVTKEKIRKEYGWKRITQARKEKIYRYLKNEVKTYNHYLTGQVYGFKHEVAELPEDYAYMAMMDAKEVAPMLAKYLDLADDLDWDTQDSCWGFYGDDHKTNGVFEYIQDNVQHLAEVIYE